MLEVVSASRSEEDLLPDQDIEGNVSLRGKD